MNTMTNNSISGAEIEKRLCGTPAAPPWKKQIIQLILIERQRAGEALIKVEEEFKAGREPQPRLAASINSSAGKIHAWLWVLRAIEPDLGRFYDLLETLGWHADDDEINALHHSDGDLMRFAGCAGEMAANAVRMREARE